MLILVTMGPSIVREIKFSFLNISATLWLLSFIIHDLNVSQNVTRCVYVLWLFLRICWSVLLSTQITYNQILFRFGHICELYIKNYCRTTHNWAKKIPEPHDHFILLWFHEIHNWCWHFFFLKSRSFKILAYCLVCNKRASVYFILLLSFLWPQFIWKQVFLKEDVFLTYQILP